jgi:anti-sigma factor RsiW
MNPKCNSWQEQIWMWTEGELDDADVSALEEHLKTCVVCREEAARQRQLTQLLTAAAEVSPSPGFGFRFQQRLEARRHRGRTWTGAGILILAGLAFAAALFTPLILAGADWWQSLPLESLLNISVKASIILGDSAATLFNVALLLGKATTRSLNQPVFGAFAIFTAALCSVWAIVISRKSGQLVPATVSAK